MNIDIHKIDSLLKDRLSEKRYYHSVCVAKAAESLAKIYGASTKSAYLAGLIHDVMRCETEENMLNYMTENGIMLTELEQNSSVLWHSVLGADYISRHLNIIDADIINAVRYHTTARAGMSLLEQIIFLADCSSADRVYPDVERIRSLINSDINLAMIAVIEFTINDLKSKGKPVHPDTLDAYREFISFKC